MNTQLERVLPMDIEKRSFKIIESELPHPIDPALAPIIKRVIHTSADFEYADTLCFSEDVVAKAHAAIKAGACIVTDTQMAKAGINKKNLAKYGGEVYCFISDDDVAKAAKEQGTTRAATSMDKAPTALVRICELIEEGKLKPELVIGVPVGFVNVVQSKEMIMKEPVPYIVARGRKGGSNVAACIVNALLYMLGR